VGSADELTPTRPHVWGLDVTAPWFDALADSDVVSAQERARAEALSDASAARRLLARRTALRLVICKYIGQQPEDMRIVTAPGGKPVLVPSGSHRCTFTFATAHSGDLYCVAVGSTASLGLDVELLRHVPRARAIAVRWFGLAETEGLRAAPDDAVDAEFMRLWTAKEALAKRHGAGLRLMMGRDEVELDVGAASKEGRLRAFSLGPQYAATIASTDVIADVDVFRPGDDSWIT
jgi:4'-phosphopantetheinyl transferase